MAKIIEIENLNSPELQVYWKLTENQLRNRLEPEKGIFIAQTGKVIALALENGWEPVSLLAEQGSLSEESREILPQLRDVPVYTAPREVLQKLTGYPLTRGVLCAMRRKPLPIHAHALCDKGKSPDEGTQQQGGKSQKSFFHFITRENFTIFRL